MGDSGSPHRNARAAPAGRRGATGDRTPTRRAPQSAVHGPHTAKKEYQKDKSSLTLLYTRRTSAQQGQLIGKGREHTHLTRQHTLNLVSRNISLRGSALCVSLSQSPPDLLRLHQLPLGCAQRRPIRMPISTRCTRAQNRRRGLRSAQCACARLARCVCTRRGRHPSSPRRRRRRLRDPLPKRASP